MKTLPPLLACSLLVGCVLPAQVPDPSFSAPVAAAAERMPAPFTQEQLDQLLGPVALYPDALLALILPASTNPSDVVLAARFLQSGGLPGQADLQPWDESVRGLARFPQLIRWMDENLAWTKQLGDAFAMQPADVMNALQRLRTRAREAGTLTDTAQQQVVLDGSTIAIVPADPEVIYVPYYDPAVVYVPRYSSSVVYSSGPLFGFSTGFATGWWLSYGMDWSHRRVWCVPAAHRERHWSEHRRDWQHYHRRPPVEHQVDIRIWQPHSGRPNRFTGRGDNGTIGRPEGRTHDWRRDGSNEPGHDSLVTPTDRRPDLNRSETRQTPNPGYRNRRERSDTSTQPAPFVGPTAPGLVSTATVPTAPALISQPPTSSPSVDPNSGGGHWRGRGDSPRGMDRRARVEPAGTSASVPTPPTAPARVDRAPREPGAVRMPGDSTPRNSAPEPRYRPPQSEPRHPVTAMTAPTYTPPPSPPPSSNEGSNDDGKTETSGRRPPFTRAR